MQKNLLNKQLKSAHDNFNYFFMMMIIKITRSMLLLASILILNIIFDNIIIYIVTLIYTLYTIYKIYNIIDIYKYILNDIQNTFSNEKFHYIINTNTFKNNLFGKVVKYGK